MNAKILEKSTNKIVNHNYVWANYPALPIGLDPSIYEMLVIVEGNLLPDHDSRLYLINEQHDVQSELPNSDGYRTISVIRSLERRPVEYIIAQLEEIETNATNTIVNLQKQVKTLIYAVNALLRDAQGLTLTQREIKAKDKISNFVVKISQNDDNFEQLKTAVENGFNPDLNIGWIENGVNE